VQGEAEVLEVGRRGARDVRANVVVVVRLLADLPETVGVFVVSGGDDFLLHVAVPDTDALYAFVIDRLTERREVADVRTSVVYEHIRRPVLEPLGSDTRT
jgi:DNA-binding Lrp family transcriptional regulator